VLQQCADLLVGALLRGRTPAEQLAYLATPAGWIYAATLAAFALMRLLTRPHA
jgi:hypothetical protein